MNEENKNQKFEVKPTKSIIMIRTLVGVAVFCGILIVLVFQWTFPTIKKNKAEYLQKAIFEVIPCATKTTTFKQGPQGKLVLLAGEDDKAIKYYAGYDESNNLCGVAIEAEGQGFQDVIRILYGYSPQEQTISGFKVLESKETPGLGDKIEKDPQFLANFEALDVKLAPDQKDLEHAIQVVKKGKKVHPWQIDTITGATISSKAIGRMLNKNAQERIPIVVNNLAILRRGN